MTSQSGTGSTVEDETENENQAVECVKFQEIMHCRSLPTLQLTDIKDSMERSHSIDRLLSLSDIKLWLHVK